MSVFKRILIVIAVIVLFRVLRWAYLELRRWVPGVLRRRVTRQADNVIALTERCQTTGQTCSAMGEAHGIDTMRLGKYSKSEWY